MTNHISTQIRQIARELLESKTVKCVIGYKKGTIPMREQICFARSPEQADELIWSGFCVLNQSKFLIGVEEPTAIVAQGCVTRNIIGLIRENRVKRENVHILGINSPGMLDHRKIAAKFPGREIKELWEHEDKIIASGKGFKETFPRKLFKRDNCYTCTHRNPVIYDQMIGEAGPETGGGNIDNTASPWEKKDYDQRWKIFTETFKDCIRCYACRDACPLCYCRECFVDSARPQWCGKTVEEADVHTFHILRAFHCAGRCTDCGACESACPVGIKMRRLTSKIEKDIRKMYGYSPGLKLDARLPLTEFSLNDPEGFIG